MKYIGVLIVSLVLTGCEPIKNGATCGDNGYVYDPVPGTSIAELHKPLTSCIRIERMEPKKP